MRICFIFLCFCFIPLMSCTSEPSTIAEYKLWFSDEKNGYIKTKEINNLIFKVQYRPVDLSLLNEIDPNRTYNLQEIDSLRNTYSNSLYFILEVSLKQVSAIDKSLILQQSKDYLATVEKASFGINENIRLITPSDTIKPSFYHYENGYELGSRERFIFAFKKKEGIEWNEMIFSYEDEFFSASTLNFKFDIREDILPKLPIKIKES